MKLVIRKGADVNTVEVDGRLFDRTLLDRATDKKLCRMIRDAFRVEQQKSV